MSIIFYLLFGFLYFNSTISAINIPTIGGAFKTKICTTYNEVTERLKLLNAGVTFVNWGIMSVGSLVSKMTGPCKGGTSQLTTTVKRPWTSHVGCHIKQ